MDELATERLRAEARAQLIAVGVPEDAVDGALDSFITDFLGKADAAVRDFELRGAQAIFVELNQPAEMYPWEDEDEATKENYIRAFGAAVNFIDEETYDPNE